MNRHSTRQGIDTKKLVDSQQFESNVKSLRRARNAARMSRGLSASLRQALPSSDSQLVGRIVAQLLDLQDYGKRLTDQLREIEKMRFPKDRQLLRSLLSDIEEVLIYHGGTCIDGLRNDIPIFLKELEKKKANR